LIFYRLSFGGQSINQLFVSALSDIGIQLKFASMLYALLFVAINFIPAYILYKKKIFIKL